VHFEIIVTNCASTGLAQKPSSASPTQLHAKIEQTIAATDAAVVMVCADRMTKALFR
jgi:hypothetical protein